MHTLQITALFASGTARISAELDQITTPNIRYKTYDLHAVDELTGSDKAADAWRSVLDTFRRVDAHKRRKMDDGAENKPCRSEQAKHFGYHWRPKVVLNNVFKVFRRRPT